MSEWGVHGAAFGQVKLSRLENCFVYGRGDQGDAKTRLKVCTAFPTAFRLNPSFRRALAAS